jgi:hypothetical protein
MVSTDTWNSSRQPWPDLNHLVGFVLQAPATHQVPAAQAASTMATRNPNLNILPSLKRATTPAELEAADAELHGPRGDWWWTGKRPQECPGFDAEAGVLR